MVRRARSRLTYANVMVTLLAVAVVGGGAVAVGGVSDGQGRIQACCDRKGKDRGEVRLLVKGKCKRRTERKISWAQEGPPGESGPAGEQGLSGAQGPPGARGPAGSPDTPQ
jgi:hypothetical protein